MVAELWTDPLGIPRHLYCGLPIRQPGGGRGSYGHWGDKTTVTCRCERSE